MSDSPAVIAAPVDVTPAQTSNTDAKKIRKLMPGGYYWGTGRRKAAVARVRVKPGEGKYLINDRPSEKYFSEPEHQNDIYAPLRAVEQLGKVNIAITVHGGGLTGQAGAIKLGLARALLHLNAEYERALRDGGFLTRDSRKVERKKYGQSGARKRFQFSKR